MASGGRARAAAIYPFQLCKAILRGFRNQMRADGRMVQGVYGLQSLDWEDEKDLCMRVTPLHHIRAVAPMWCAQKCSPEPSARRRRGSMNGEEEMESVLAKFEQESFRDAVTGQSLYPALVREARREELEYFASKGVWYKRPRAEAYKFTGKPPISVKWVDVNKNDDLAPKYRPRLVAREMRQAGEDTIFAPTPPLESLRTVLSMAATDLAGDLKHDRGAESEDRTQIMVLDISRAYFNAKKDEGVDPTYVELPREDPDRAEGFCGLLRVHMYGTRAAADGWHNECSRTLEEMGFLRGDASACVFRQADRRLVASVHGDDFCVCGPKRQLDWMRDEMRKRYELTENGRLGPGKNDDKEVKILNRIARWTEGGVQYEADPRQAERLVSDLGLEDAKRVGTPGVKQTFEMASRDKPLAEEKYNAFRAIAARGNYLGPDRPETQFAAKEICRWMAAPSEMGVQALKRLGRYLDSHRRLVFDFPFQSADNVEV